MRNFQQLSIALFVAFCCLAPGLRAGAQTTKQPEAAAEYTIVEQMPEAPYNFGEYLGKNIKYPAQALKDKVQGVVYVSFQVAPDGSIKDVQVTKGIQGLDEEAVRAIAAMPAWLPGKQGGVAVPVRCQVPVRFRL